MRFFLTKLTKLADRCIVRLLLLLITVFPISKAYGFKWEGRRQSVNIEDRRLEHSPQDLIMFHLYNMFTENKNFSLSDLKNNEILRKEYSRLSFSQKERFDRFVLKLFGIKDTGQVKVSFFSEKSQSSRFSSLTKVSQFLTDQKTANPDTYLEEAFKRCYYKCICSRNCRKNLIRMLPQEYHQLTSLQKEIK